MLREPSRKPGKAPLPASTVNKIVALTCTEPPGQVTHWIGRAMAKAAGISLRAVQRIWEAHRLQPHRIRTFKKSRDPAFAAKVEGVVGLYMDPPAHAVVVSVDEESQIQALDRTQPGLPLGAEAVIPSNPSRTRKYLLDPHLYAQRHLVECCFSRLKQFRRVATRYEKPKEIISPSSPSSFACGKCPHGLDRGTANAGLACNLRDGQPICRKQHDPRPLNVLLRAIAITDDRGQPLTILGIDDDADRLSYAPRIAEKKATANPLFASVH